MAERSFDLIVIGSGPGGQKAALQAAKAGKTAAIVEEYFQVGGGCAYFGTLPSKSFRESVYRWSLGSRGTLGQEMSRQEVKELVIPDMARLLARRNRVLKNEALIVKNQLERNRVEIFYGRGEIQDEHTVRVQESHGKTTLLRGNFLVIATGCQPMAPQGVRVDGEVVFDSNCILNLKKVPRSMTVLGGGIIGCEYASMFAMVGTKVHLVDQRPRLLSNVDHEIVECLSKRLKDEGCEFHFQTQMSKVILPQRDIDPVKVYLENGEVIETEALLIALGRLGNTSGLGLEKIGIQPNDRGLVPVNEHYQTSVPHVYAVGDVIGSPALAATSMEQGRYACCHAFEISGVTAGKMGGHFPYGIYTIPEISMIGPTEEQLQEMGVEYVAGKAKYKELARGQIVGDQWGMMKLLVGKKH